MKPFIRHKYYDELLKPLKGPVNFIQAVVGPRQVGKTTLALQLLDKWAGPKLYATADQPATPSAEWIDAQWEEIRKKRINAPSRSPALLILDEIQKIPHWSERVKNFFDEDRRLSVNLRVVLLGSSALLMQRGLTESLAGRFELHRHFQWSYLECHEYFRIRPSEYIFFGGYPGALSIRKDENRWAKYVRDSLIETVLSKDILLLSPIAKPVLLRQCLGLALDYHAQVVSYQKMLGTLQDVGNTTTIASYLQLLSKAFLVVPLERWSGARIRQRGSIPKMLALDNGLVSAMAGISYQEVHEESTRWGRLVENAVGSQLYFMAQRLGGELFYWRDRDCEIDYILKIGGQLKAIEVKSGEASETPRSFETFQKKYKKAVCVIISNSKSKGTDSQQIDLNDFFSDPLCVLK